MREGRDDDAVATVDIVLDASDRATPADRWRAHMVRGTVFERKGVPSASEGEIAGMLGALPGMDDLPHDLGVALEWASRAVGQERLRQLIADSPSADVLLPFTVALEREQGVESHVAREVEEVAEDIRRNLAKPGREPFPPGWVDLRSALRLARSRVGARGPSLPAVVAERPNRVAASCRPARESGSDGALMPPSGQSRQGSC